MGNEPSRVAQSKALEGVDAVRAAAKELLRAERSELSRERRGPDGRATSPTRTAAGDGRHPSGRGSAIDSAGGGPSRPRDAEEEARRAAARLKRAAAQRAAAAIAGVLEPPGLSDAELHARSRRLADERGRAAAAGASSPAAGSTPRSARSVDGDSSDGDGGSTDRRPARAGSLSMSATPALGGGSSSSKESRRASKASVDGGFAEGGDPPLPLPQQINTGQQASPRTAGRAGAEGGATHDGDGAGGGAGGPARGAAAVSPLRAAAKRLNAAITSADLRTLSGVMALRRHWLHYIIHYCVHQCGAHLDETSRIAISVACALSPLLDINESTLRSCVAP